MWPVQGINAISFPTAWALAEATAPRGLVLPNHQHWLLATFPRNTDSTHNQIPLGTQIPPGTTAHIALFPTVGFQVTTLQG